VTNHQDMPYPLETEQLSKVYDNFHALKQVSLRMESGEIFGLLGPNGAGKTTLIGVLSNLVRPTSGKAKIFGSDVSLELKAQKKLVGLVPQELVNHGFFSVEEVLSYVMGYYGLKPDRNRIYYLLEKLGLIEHKKKKILQLSGGMKRRFLIAKALVHEPKLLLLDEPTAGVDIELRNTLWDFVREINKTEGVSVLLTTHYLEEAENLCKRVAIIDKGELKEIGPTKDLVKKLTQRRVEVTLRKAPEKRERPHFVEFVDNKYIFTIPNNMTVGELLQQCKIPIEDVLDLQIREGRLEDAFLAVLSGKE